MQDAFARYSRNAALREFRRQHPVVLDDEQVGHGSTDDVAALVQQQALGNGGIAPFGAGQHVLEPVEMLDAGKPRLGRQPCPAPMDLDPGAAEFFRVYRQRSRHDDARGQ
ncbi:hypothetical protein D3C83_12740 [compost metagenome]